MEETEPIDALTFLHFNDAYNIQTDKHGQLGFINFYDYLRRKKKEYPSSLLIFSGDCFAPSKLSRIFKGEQMAHCIKQLGIDIACYGNHDFDFAPTQVQKLVSECKFPWLMGNIKYSDTGKNIGDGLDYYIIKHQGIKIGFMGLAGPDFKGRLISQYTGKLTYYQIKEYGAKIAQKLREQGCELIVALTHCRKPVDIELAKAVPQIDIILGGHDHHLLLQQVNATPILKSASDFEYLSTIQIRRLGAKINPDKQITTMIGRRWVFQIKPNKVPKTTQYYPELQKFIDDAVQKLKEYEQNKMKPNNKPRKVLETTPESDWFVRYDYLNNRPTLTLKVGLSAQVCFAKYMAFKRKCFYVGYERRIPALQANFVDKMLQFVYKQVKSHENQGKSVLYSPGICNVPYLVETANMIYLPSHFLVGVNNISALQQMLGQAQDKGYQCYAVLGYDPFFKTHLCAWIKFVEAPQQYWKLISKFQVQNVVIMSVHDSKGTNHGAQRNCRLINRSLQKEQTSPYPGDIYINFIRSDTEKDSIKQVDIFCKLIEDKPRAFWQQKLKEPPCVFMHDWQSGIDCIDTIQDSFKSYLCQFKINYYKILHRSSWPLYMTAYHLGKAFIEYNYDKEKHEVSAKGVVFNQYIMSNPTYELNYGYIPMLYWQFYSKNEERILKELNEGQKKYKRWFNMHKGTHLRLIQKDSKIINTDHEGKELGLWVTKFAPKEFTLKYLPFELFYAVLSKLNLIVDC